MIVFFLMVLSNYLKARSSPPPWEDRNPHPVAVAKQLRRVLLSNNDIIVITQFFGDGWQSERWQEGAISCTAGPMRNGKYMAILLSDFEPATLH